MRMTEDFWNLMDQFVSLFFGIPRFLAPKAWDARSRLKEACTQHLRDIEEKYDSIQVADPDWEENLGSRANRAKNKAFRDHGLSIEGRGAQLAGFLIGYVLSLSSLDLTKLTL